MRLRAFGGEGGIRTPAPVARPKALAKPPLRPLGYFSVPSEKYINIKLLHLPHLREKRV